MKLSFKFKPTLNELQFNIIEELSFHTSKLYNMANYECRENAVKSYTPLEKEFKSNWHREFLHSHNYQQCLKVLEQNWKSYFKALEDYKKHPGKYKGMPKPPKYKNINTKKNEVIFTKAGIRFRENTLMLSLSKCMQSLYGVNSLNFEITAKFQKLIKWNAIQQVKIKFDNKIKSWVLIIIYEVETPKLSKNTNIMAIDLGLTNLATITFKDNAESYLIDGKVIKSVNCYINKKIANLQSIRMKQTGSENFKSTKRINMLYKYRQSYFSNYMHKASRMIVDLAIQHNVGKIVIGDITNIKQESKIKNFVQVLIAQLVSMIEYKAALKGIEVTKVKESYSSGVSAYDLEPVEKAYYNKNRRVKRGLFITNKGYKVNADINGSLNIMRLYDKKCTPKLIQSAMGKGLVNNPIRIRVA